MTTSTLKKQGKAYVESLGLKVVKCSYSGGIADKTACVFVRGGKLIIERHVKLDDSQSTLRNAIRQTRAAKLLNTECTSTSPDFYEMLSTEQKAQIEPEIFGYVYVTL